MSTTKQNYAKIWADRIESLQKSKAFPFDRDVVYAPELAKLYEGDNWALSAAVEDALEVACEWEAWCVDDGYGNERTLWVFGNALDEAQDGDVQEAYMAGRKYVPPEPIDPQVAINQLEFNSLVLELIHGGAKWEDLTAALTTSDYYVPGTKQRTVVSNPTVLGHSVDPQPDAPPNHELGRSGVGEPEWSPSQDRKPPPERKSIAREAVDDVMSLFEY